MLLASCGGASPDQGALTVLAAASLTDAFAAIEGQVEADGLAVATSFAGSQTVVEQLRQGAPVDVVATADERSMQQLVAADLVDRPVVFARNALVIAVEPGNPEAVQRLDDLARPDLAVVLADPSVPAGRYAAAALTAASVVVRPRSLELDVRAALAKVVAGEADAALVYATDVRAAAGRADAIPVPGADAVYPVAVVRATDNRKAAEAFVARLLDSRGRAALLAQGFRLP